MVGGSRQSGELDGSDIISGGELGDVIIGDNGTIGDAADAAGMLVALAVDGQGTGDDIKGDAGSDRIFGQEGADDVSGGTEADYIEGNDDNDSLSGDAGDDDIIGGSSAADGLIDADRTGNGAADAGETLLSGGPGLDYIAGDNALISRTFPVPGRAAIELFDVATVGSPAGAGNGWRATRSRATPVTTGSSASRVTTSSPATSGHRPKATGPVRRATTRSRATTVRTRSAARTAPTTSPVAARPTTV